MIQPKFAPVRPRISAPHTGEPILLEDYVASLIERQQPFTLKLSGAEGVGRHTAIEHLAALTFPIQPVIARGTREILTEDRDERFVVLAPRVSARANEEFPGATNPIETVFLLPWSDDDLIEYLLTKPQADVGDIVARCRAMNVIEATRGKPCICRLIVDTMISDHNVDSTSDCIRKGMRRLLQSDRNYERAQRRGLGLRCRVHFSPEINGLLRLWPVTDALAAERLVERMVRRGDAWRHTKLSYRLLPSVIELADRLGVSSEYQAKLLSGENAAFYASVFHAIDPQWRPDRFSVRLLKDAVLPNACWSEADLTRIQAQRVDLRSSDLCGALIHSGMLVGANLNDCRFCMAKISDTSFADARLNRADFHGADLTWVSFQGAGLISANFKKTELTSVDFSRAHLKNCCFAGASLNCTFSGADMTGVEFIGCQGDRCSFSQQRLRETEFSHSAWVNCTFRVCDLEFARITNASFVGSSFSGSYLSGSRMREVDLREVDLSGTGLADIDWQGVDLRNADLSGCAFHMGSSRSGLVGSPYPGHGSKTGFYTDDFDDGWHRPVEEIRKANLSGADLRGANVDNTDFYLVDLRAALYDRRQYEHFLRCDAILTDRHR